LNNLFKSNFLSKIFILLAWLQGGGRSTSVETQLHSHRIRVLNPMLNHHRWALLMEGVFVWPSLFAFWALMYLPLIWAK